ncbi:hypothetical protein C0Q91_20650 [Streptomyces albidoflavus]|uniref:Uncharacterized protein n=1 Tax=Streptomyces albidoflavus TaxID=1886 RepID=A0AB37XAC8_9ACTN|nr:hypothetical protein B9S66_10375 [Streptomyces sp. SM17]RZE36040.1 hypothetical protein C0Q91_20650 [Streptomyces albidoflavus]RZE52752.1 hypothetical protein C0Q97_20260 [Streptomyces albidoflavus]
MAGRRVVPAHAGVVPTSSSTSCGASCGPRTRGGSPEATPVVTNIIEWSPRRRGKPHPASPRPGAQRRHRPCSPHPHLLP